MKSINPYNNKTLLSYNESKPAEVTKILDKVQKDMQSWQTSPFNQRRELFEKLADLLEEQVEELSKLPTLEMGKPISQSRAEIKKCASLCKYYAEHAEKFLADKPLTTDYSESLVSYEPLGIILAIMPWNYPFWQVFRQAVPSIIAGNCFVLKHASNVPQSAKKMEELFKQAGFPEYCFTTLLMEAKHTETVLKHPAVRGVALTGSEAAGSAVASIAGKNLKRSLLELGGSDPFIILPDADITKTVEGAMKGRFQNNGQSCIAAKRFLIHEAIYDEFTSAFTNKVKAQKMGDPMEEDTDIGPLAQQKFVKEIHEQVQKSVQKGATITVGGKPAGSDNQFYEPTLLENVNAGMPAFDEELFGPVAACIKISSEEQAIELANNSRFGLGATIWSKDTDKAQKLAKKIKSGTVTINGIVKSDPGIPFGGVKASGYGRELAKEGILEFVNVKAININS